MSAVRIEWHEVLSSDEEKIRSMAHFVPRVLELFGGDYDVPERPRLYDAETRSFRYVVFGKEKLTCYSMVGVSEDEATAVADECDDIAIVTPEAFQGAASKVLRVEWDTARGPLQ